MINQAFEMKFKMSKISPPNVKNKTATYWYSPTYKYEFSSWVKSIIRDIREINRLRNRRVIPHSRQVKTVTF